MHRHRIVKSVAGFGPALVDYIHIIDRYPERGGHAVVKKTVKSPGGAAANVIYGLSLYGMRCGFYSPVGNDEDGELFLRAFRETGVDTTTMPVVSDFTGKVECYVDSGGERTFFVHPGSSCRLEYLNPDETELSEFDLLYFDPYPCMESFDFHLKIGGLAEGEDVKIALNPGYPYTKLGFKKLRELFSLTDIVIMNRDELKYLGTDPEKILRAGVEIVVVTEGEMGSIAFTENERVRADIFRTDVIDTTGAGDGFSTGFLYGYLMGYELKTCLLMGNWIASKNISGIGARNFPSREEFRRFLEGIS